MLFRKAPTPILPAFVGIQEKALELEQMLQRKERDHEAHLQQLSRASQCEDELLNPRPEAIEDLKIEVRDSIMNIQHLVATHNLRTVQVSGSLSIQGRYMRCSIAGNQQHKSCSSMSQGRRSLVALG